MARQKQQLSDQLRQAIEKSGLSRYAVCKACDIDQGSMSRFMAGQVGLSLDTIDRIGDFLGLDLVERKTQKGR